MPLSAKTLSSLVPLTEDPSSEIVDWLRYAATKFPLIESIFLFRIKEPEGHIDLCAGVYLSEACKLSEQQLVRKQLRELCADHGMDVMGLKDITVLDELTLGPVSDKGLQVYRRKV